MDKTTMKWQFIYKLVKIKLKNLNWDLEKIKKSTKCYEFYLYNLFFKYNLKKIKLKSTLKITLLLY